jgi:hypothetical protein
MVIEFAIFAFGATLYGHQGVDMIKMFVSSLSAIHSYYVYQTLVNIDIM